MGDLSVEPCSLCESGSSGPGARTPYGICESCACTSCRGFRWRDDRGFLCTGQPFLTKTNCASCNGVGTRAAETAHRVSVAEGSGNG